MNWATLDRILAERDKIMMPPPDSFNSAEYAQRYGYCGSKARTDLAAMVASGKLKKTMVKVKSSWVPYYTAVKSEPGSEDATTNRSDRRGRGSRRHGRVLSA